MSYVVDLAVQLQRDADLTDVELHRRDRTLLRTGSPEPRDRRSLLRLWIDALRRQGPELPGRTIGLGYRLAAFALAILGVAVGWGVAALVFDYDGARPVNVIDVLAVFVVVQLGLLVLLALVMLPRALTRRIPGAVALQETVAWLSPGQLTRLVIRRLPQRMRDALGDTLHRAVAHGRLFGSVRKWAILFPAQVFALAFNLGALAGCLYLIAFSDLAFSWSTTLDPDTQRAHRVTQILSMPWAKVVPQAVPSVELIETTLYYRRTDVSGEQDPGRWGGWWPFLVACMVTYGALPRVLLLTIAGWRLARSANLAFVDAPGVAVVLDRLTSQMVSTQATSPESEVMPEPSVRTEPRSATPVSVSRLRLINWGGIDAADETVRQAVRSAWKKDVLSVHRAGGNATLAADAETISAISTEPEEAGIALLVKGWEPPVLEFLDFVRELRDAVGARRLILVTPVGVGPGGRLAPPKDSDLGQWRRRIQSLGDPAVVFRPWMEAASVNP